MRLNYRLLLGLRDQVYQTDKISPYYIDIFKEKHLVIKKIISLSI
ncbi:hypothetical protein DOT_0555 [Desulfosporosinus sp. OT]|nr:hypothetical protein DOT_0555 [Desulfosporosinus sp. OT]